MAATVTATPVVPTTHVDDREPTGTSIVPDSTVLDFNGRTYQGYREGKYFLPNDSDEQDRLDFQHAMCNLLFGTLHFAPIRDPEYVLDVGTGTGIWALDFAQANPQTTVVGTDLSRIQPSRTNVPNCSFVQEDAEEEWIFTVPFDYIHLRALTGCFNDTRKVIDQAYKSLKPGGYLEFQDSWMQPHFVDQESQSRAVCVNRWAHLMAIGAYMVDRPLDRLKSYRKWMVDRGFVDVAERQLRLPGSPWSTDPCDKQVGRYALKNFGTHLEGISFKFLQASGMSPEEIRAFVQDVHREISNPAIKWYLPIYIVFGRKPVVEES